MLKFKKEKNIFKAKTVTNNFQIFDLLQLSRKERECRTHCISSMRKFDQWKKMHKSREISALSFYTKIEGVMLRRQAQDAIFFYRIIKNDRVRAFNDYMQKLPVRSGVFGVSS